MYEGILSWLNLIKYIWEIVRSIARDEESVKKEKKSDEKIGESKKEKEKKKYKLPPSLC